MTIGIEHILREIQQYYICKRNKVNKKLFEKLPTKFAKLWLQGYSLELMDGDNSYIPIEWLKAVFEHSTNFLKSRFQGKEPKFGVIPIMGV